MWLNDNFKMPYFLSPHHLNQFPGGNLIANINNNCHTEYDSKKLPHE